MNKTILSSLLFFSATVSISAQEILKSIQNNHTELIINDSIFLKKGEQIQIYVPAGKDFVFVKPKKTGFNSKLLGKIVDIAGTGASAVGLSSENIKVLEGTTKILNTVDAVNYGADTLDKIQKLPISNSAKKSAGKKMEIMEWAFTDNGYVITASLDKKMFEISLQEAVMAGEIKLK